jgi:hypothetical protein
MTETATTGSPDDTPTDPVTPAAPLPSAAARKVEEDATPGLTGSATKKPGSNSKPRRESESIEIYNELHEREKESLCAQIATLDKRLAKSSNKNQLALRQPRQANETDLIQVKKDLDRENIRQHTRSEMDRRIADAVEVSKDEWKKTMETEVKAHVAEEQEHSDQQKQEHEAENRSRAITNAKSMNSRTNRP